jgi:anti-sigma B factor antagonist
VPAAEQFSIALEASGPVVVLVATGEVDAHTVADLSAAVDRAVTEHERHVVIDAEAITFIDSTGITALVAGMRRLNRSRRRLAVACAPGSPTGRALAMTGLDRSLEVHPSLSAAVASLADAPLLGR